MSEPNVDELYKEFSSTPSSSVDANVDKLYNEFSVPTTSAKPVEAHEKAEFWQGLNNDPSWAALAKRVGIGALRGGKDVVDTGAELLAQGTSAVADKVLPESLAAPIRQSAQNTIVEDKASRDQYNKDYPSSEGIIPTAADVGRVGGQILASAPVMPAKIIQGIRAASGALPTILSTGEKVAAPIINRLGSAIGVGAAGGAVVGGATSSINDEGLASNVGKGALTGAVAGPILTGLGQAGKAIGGKVLGKVSSTVADLAKRAEELGIDLKATQVSGSPLLKKFDQISGMLPFSGSQGITDKQVSQFTTAVSRTFGANTDEITPQIVSQARKTIGGNMEKIYNSATISADPQLAQDLTKIVNDAVGTHAEGELKPIVTQIRNVISKIDSNGTIAGDAYNGLVKYDAMLSQAQQSRNPNIANSANRIRSALEDALDRSLPPDQKAALTQTRSQYKAAMTVKDLVDTSADGTVSPLKLMQKVVKSPGGKLRSGELGELADIGRKFFPTPADSGTPLGEKIITNLGSFLHNPLSAATATGSALLSGATALDVASGGAGLLVNRLLRTAVNSNVARRALIRSGTGETHGIINKLGEAVEPYSSQLSQDKQKDRHPLRITVYK